MGSSVEVRGAVKNGVKTPRGEARNRSPKTEIRVAETETLMFAVMKFASGTKRLANGVVSAFVKKAAKIAF